MNLRDRAQTLSVSLMGLAASLLLFGSHPALRVEIFWLVAVAYLLSGRWSGGDPAAWSTGDAVPWPSAAEQRGERERKAGGRAGPRPKPAARTPSKPASTSEAVTTTARTRATTPKRKRKRRQ